jgi:hypothetical protein
VNRLKVLLSPIAKNRPTMNKAFPIAINLIENTTFNFDWWKLKKHTMRQIIKLFQEIQILILSKLIQFLSFDYHREPFFF